MFTPSPRLKAMGEELFAKQDLMASIHQEATLPNGDFDFLKAAPFKTLSSQKACLDKLEEMDAELAEKQTQYKTQEAIEKRQYELQEQIKERDMIDNPMIHDAGVGTQGQRFSMKSLGQLVAEAWPKDSTHPQRNGVWMEKDFQNFEIKTLMQTSAGFAPESTRLPRIAEFAHRPVQVTDLFPIATTGQASIVYMEETTSTNAAAETAEAGEFPESAEAFTERTVNIKKIATYIPVNTVAA